MGGGLESHGVCRVYGAYGAVRHHPHRDVTKLTAHSDISLA